MAYQIQIRLFNRLVLPVELDAFEAELARHNLSLEISEQRSSGCGSIFLKINCTAADDESFVQEVAALCFGDAPAV